MVPSGPEIIERVRALAPKFAGRAEAAEKGRRMPPELVREMLDAGIARILMPQALRRLRPRLRDLA